MLALSRHVGEKIFIDVNGERIEIMLIEVRLGKARVGIEAPKHMKITREEHWTREKKRR